MNRRGNFWQMKIWQSPGFIGYKVGAIVIALLVWGYVIFAQNPLVDTIHNIPLEIRNISNDLAILDNTYQIQVRAQGSSADIKNLTSGDIVVYVDLDGIGAGISSLEVKVDMPDNIEVVSLIPNTISVELAEIKSKSFPLEVKISGEPAENNLLLDSVVSPAQITLYGAKDYIDNVHTVSVRAEITGLSENYNKNLQVEVMDFNGNNISEHFIISPSVASLIIPVVYDLPEKSIAVNASIIGTPANGFKISRIVAEPSIIKAFGDLDILNGLYYLETEPIDVTGLKKSYSQTVNIVHENSISLSTSTITVIIQIEPVATATFVREVIYAQNLSADLRCKLPFVEMQVKVSGPKTYLDSITANEIVPFIDCSDIETPGEYILPLSATLPANIALISISLKEIKITVESANKK